VQVDQPGNYAITFHKDCNAQWLSANLITSSLILKSK
jgi:hypothetical protein